MDYFGMGRAASIVAMIVVILVIIFACFWFFHSAPPKTITITSGEKGSAYYSVAEKYAKILARDGVKLVILPSAGSVENLQRLTDRTFKVDIGFVQAGLAKGQNVENLVSLGSVSYQPLLIFHRLGQPVEVLSQLAGRRIAIGREGSGTRKLALALLSVNGIEPGGGAAFLDAEGEEAAAALLAGKADAIFLMADSASSQTMRTLLKAPGIGLVNFTQADAYVRRIGYLNKLTMPKGAMDFGKNIPTQNITLVCPTVELIARDNLHPALTDLLLAAAVEIHGRAALFQNRGDFPVALENEFKISGDAKRFYKSGKSFFYRYLPFWLASLINRILVVFVPLIIILIPGLKSIPALFRWRMSLRINRWYRLLLLVEQDAGNKDRPRDIGELIRRLDEIESEVNQMKVPASYGDQFYVLRTHINFVRTKLQNTMLN
ncbi:MAG: C4-dicarboxylate ABC transporter substrate-binding protein [Deltaproteobacteria bacterium HGW-Deltaproteobacteria-6]|nr:MAG: C4-dicarboxylate ABC transporter substrate-binding protein [Deltaproteobacteria bacterium HGW-Deltaproteobacteria-6]